MKSNWLLVMS